MRIVLLTIDHDIQSISRKTSSQSACKADVSLSEAIMPECLMVHMEYKKHALTIVVPIRQGRCGLDCVQHSFPFKDCSGKTTYRATTIGEVTLSITQCWIQIFFRVIILITVQDQVCFIWRSGCSLWSGNTRSYDSTLGKALFCFPSVTAFRTSSNPWKKNDMTSYRKTRIADLHSIKRNSRFLRHSDFTVVKSILHPLWSYSWFDLQWNKKVFLNQPATDFLWSQELDCTVGLLHRNASWRIGKAFKHRIRPHNSLRGKAARSNPAVESILT